MSATAPVAPQSALKRFFALDLLDNRYPALHGLRVIAIVSVLQFHVTTIFALEQGMTLDADFVANSLTVFFGMDLFFMLSGFLIGSILMRSLETEGSQRIWRFYIRRICRTFPSYYVVLTFLALTTTLTVMQRKNLIYEYLYLTNFRSLARPEIVMFWGWSLALEEQFYLTVPLLFVVLWRLRTDRARVILLVGLWAAGLGSRLYIYFHNGPWTDLTLYRDLYFRTHTRFDTLVAGLLLAQVHYRWRDAITEWLKNPLHRALLALPSLSCLWLLLRPWMFGWDKLQFVHVFAWGSVTTVMYFGWLILLLHSDGPIQRMLSAPLFRRLATLGYGVYLVHIPLLDHVLVPIARKLYQRHVSMTLVWPITLAVLLLGSLAIGYLMHIFIEKPSLRLREKLAA